MSDKTELLPTPSPVYPCANKSCGEIHSWPADDLAWSPLRKAWFCCECWDREEHGEPGILLEKELASHRPDSALRVALEALRSQEKYLHTIQCFCCLANEAGDVDQC